MEKQILAILIIMFVFCGSIIASSITSWSPPDYLITKSDNISEVQIWCELRSLRKGAEKYCRWNGKNYYLTCLGEERLYGKDIDGDKNGYYECLDY